MVPGSGGGQACSRDWSSWSWEPSAGGSLGRTVWWWRQGRRCGGWDVRGGLRGGEEMGAGAREVEMRLGGDAGCVRPDSWVCWCRWPGALPAPGSAWQRPSTFQPSPPAPPTPPPQGLPQGHTSYPWPLGLALTSLQRRQLRPDRSMGWGVEGPLNSASSFVLYILTFYCGKC